MMLILLEMVKYPDVERWAKFPHVKGFAEFTKKNYSDMGEVNLHKKNKKSIIP